MVAIQKARILNAEDVITSDIYTITEGPDRKGNFLLVNDSTQKRARAHPTRILKLCPGGSQVYRDGTAMVAKCPTCDAVVHVEIAQENSKCHDDPTHQEFDLDWSMIDTGPRPALKEPEKKTATKTAKHPKATPQRPTKQVKVTADIDFAAMRAVGEVWTREGVEFDYPSYDVKAHVLVIADGENSRKLCFNSYNGTWGKKNRSDDLHLFIQNATTPSGKTVGYFLKGTLEQEHHKLTKGGYARD